MTFTSDNDMRWDSHPSSAQSNTTWECVACTLVNSNDALRCEACNNPRNVVPQVVGGTPSQQRGGQRRNNLLNQSGKILSKSFKTVANTTKKTARTVADKTKQTANTVADKTKQTASTVADKTKQAYERHNVSEKTQRFTQKTKETGQSLKTSVRKMDEKTNFTGIVTGMATWAAANRLLYGTTKSALAAGAVAAGGVAARTHFDEEREKEREQQSSGGWRSWRGGSGRGG